jgi:hypothetical protein
MFSSRKMVLATTCLLALAGAAYADTGWLNGSSDEKIKTLEDLQPGLGTIMMEYSSRFTNAYYAAKGGNWGLAGYQIKEAREIQEVGETTRPKRASSLKAFESAYLDPLDKAIASKDFKKFEVAFKAGVQGCNACHVGQGFAFIKYELPKASASPLSAKP